MSVSREGVATPATVTRMPSKGTTRRTVRVPDEVWLPAKAKAEQRGEDLSSIVRDRLVEYIAEDQTT